MSSFTLVDAAPLFGGFGVAAQLPADRGGRAAQSPADPAQGVAGFAPEFDLHPLAQAQVMINLSHRSNTLAGVALQT